MKKMIFIIGLVGICLDQISKFLIINIFSVNDFHVVIENFFSIGYIKNKGAAWGIFSNSTLVLAVISLIFLFFMIKYVKESKNITKLESLSYGLIIGGIIGNLIDRLMRGYVIDFLSFKIINYDFPVFNIADMLIVIGVIVAAFSVFVGGSYDDSGKRKY